MSTGASTLPLREAPAQGARGRLLRALRRLGPDARVGTAQVPLWGLLGLATIVVLSLFVVVMAANRPSLLAPTTHTAFFPRWMAGPLGGLWPGLTGDGTTLKYLFSASMWAMYLAYLGVLRFAGSLPARWVVGSLLAIHAIFILSPPLALTDLFNYINYGRMEVVHNLNPYTSIPILEPHNDPSYTLSNWHELLSPYGPLFTLLTFAVVPLGVAGSFWALKLLLSLTSLGILALVWGSARLLGRDPLPAVALVGLNPIVLVWGLGGVHNDFLMLLFIMLGIYLLLAAREQERGRPPAHGLRAWLSPSSPALLGAGASFVVATGLKASAGVLIPVVLAGLLRHRRALAQVLLGMVLAGIVVGIASLLAFGLHIPDLSTQSRLVTGESIPNLVGLALGLGGESETLHSVMTGLLALSLVACCWYAWMPGPRGARGGAAERTITASGWSSVALLVTLGWVLPWYVLWVLPLAALASSRRLRTVSLIFGAYLILVWAPVSGAMFSAIGFYPEKTALGRLHQRYVRELLN